MTLIRGNAIALPLAPNSVDLIVTSPPYFALRSYTDGGEHYDGQIGSEPSPQDFLEALWAVTAECVRVLKPSGSIWVNLGDKYAGSGGHNNSNLGASASKGSGSTLQGGKQFSHREVAQAAPRDKATRRQAPDAYNKATIGGARPKSLMGLPWRYAIGCVDQLGLILRRDLIWSKPNGMPESVTDRCRSSHEYWFHFTKEGDYFAAMDEIREPHADMSWIGRDTQERINGDRNDGGKACVSANPLGKLPGSVWNIPSEPLIVPEWLNTDHFAAFPQEWPRRLILGWSPSGICTACGEGRRPVSTKERIGGTIRTEPDSSAVGAGRTPSGHMAPGALSKFRTETTITGTACACDEPTAPTRPSVVLDPFGGTGTTAMVARALGRYPVHVDLSGDYLRLARWRIYSSGHARKTVARTDRERQGVLL